MMYIQHMSILLAKTDPFIWTTVLFSSWRSSAYQMLYYFADPEAILAVIWRVLW